MTFNNNFYGFYFIFQTEFLVLMRKIMFYESVIGKFCSCLSQNQHCTCKVVQVEELFNSDRFEYSFQVNFS